MKYNPFDFLHTNSNFYQREGAMMRDYEPTINELEEDLELEDQEDDFYDDDLPSDDDDYPDDECWDD